jgi:hypothetical protein
MDCPICLSRFTKVRRSSLKCTSCALVACKECWGKYFLTIIDYKCMECKKTVKDDFLLNFAKSLLSEVRKYKRKHLNPEHRVPCPLETCRGTIDVFSGNLTCERCTSRLCPGCHNILNRNHVCNNDNVKSIQWIKGRCKPCPNCSTIIYKDGGCDLMFCRRCYHGFSWANADRKQYSWENADRKQYSWENANDVITYTEDDIKRIRELNQAALEAVEAKKNQKLIDAANTVKRWWLKAHYTPDHYVDTPQFKKAKEEFARS